MARLPKSLLLPFCLVALACNASSSLSPNATSATAAADTDNACPASEQLCPQTFSYPYHNEQSVSVMGSYSTSGWLVGTPMTQNGTQWVATVSMPYGQAVSYKFLVNGSTWVNDPANSATDASGNSLVAAQSCASPTCFIQPLPPTGVFDWRDAVIYFVFVDRFKDGDPSNNCNVAVSETTTTSSTNYLGGDWAGVTQMINSGYFKSLGVNTLWITVPIKNADDVVGTGVLIDANGEAVSDGHNYSAYHGYWPADPTTTESCFGSPTDLQNMVSAAHAQNLKVLFDYAMVHVHASSPIYTEHQNDTPAWFTPDCICGAANCGNFDTSCWFASYLAHYDYTNAAARTFSVNAAIQLIQNNGNDAFRLDAIKQVDPSWLGSLRPTITSQILAQQSPVQRFYMVGETYDFQNRTLISSLLNPTTALDGQFDFPLRIRLVEAVLMRSTENLLTLDDLNWSRNAPPGMQGLAQFMDNNDDFYPSDAVMSTFIGNHDVGRSIHYAEDPPLWSNSADNGKEESWTNQPATVETDPNAYERLANAFAVIMTNKGAPLIYYGDEIGLPGAGDPDNRRMMPWTGYTTDQQTLLQRMQTLGQIRAAHPATRRGVRTTLFADIDLWVYSVTTSLGVSSPDTLYVAINRNDVDRVTTVIPPGLTELLVGGTSTGNDTIPARQTRIFTALSPATP